MSLSYNHYPEHRHKKLTHLLKEICSKIKHGDYLDTRHALNRQSERKISRLDVIFVLQNGYHEKMKDRYDDHHREWNYAIRGKTIDGRELRIIVSFENEYLLIITAISLEKDHL